MDLLPWGELEVSRCSKSGIGIEAVRLTDKEAWLDRRSGVLEALSGSLDDDLREGRDDLWRCLSFDFGVSGS